MTATIERPISAIWFTDNVMRVHVDGDRSDGAFALVEATGRQGDMPPLHVHHRDDETFYVLEGRLTLVLRGELPIELSAGDAALAPKGVPHVYRIESDSARWLVVGTPAGFEEFVREAGEPAQADGLPPANRPKDRRRARGCRRAVRDRDPRAARDAAAGLAPFVSRGRALLGPSLFASKVALIGRLRRPLLHGRGHLSAASLRAMRWRGLEPPRA